MIIIPQDFLRRVSPQNRFSEKIIPMERSPPLRCGKLSTGIKTGIAKQTDERDFF